MLIAYDSLILLFLYLFLLRIGLGPSYFFGNLIVCWLPKSLLNFPESIISDGFFFFDILPLP